MAILAFDLDGTLITCEPRQSAVLQAAARRFGIRLDAAALWRRKREGAGTIAALRAEGVEVEPAGQVGRAWRSMVEEPAWLSLDSPFADSLAVLQGLRARGHRILVVTARAQRHWVVPQLRRLALLNAVDELRVVEPTGAPQGKARVLVEHRPAALFGDSEVDAEAARSAGIRWIALHRGQRSAEFLGPLGSGPTYGSLEQAVEAWEGRPEDDREPPG